MTGRTRWASALGGAAAIAILGLAGGTARADMPTSLGAGEGQVDIVAWPGYIERGDTDKNFDWVTDFEAKTSCKVNVKTANTSDEMVALMNEGGFDLVTASGDASLRLIAGKRVQEVNVDLIPSYKTVDERLQSAPSTRISGRPMPERSNAIGVPSFDCARFTTAGPLPSS